MDSKTLKLDVFDAGRTVEPGEKSDTVAIIQIILNALKVRYDGYGFIPVTFVFDPETVEAVKYFQKINRMSDTGVVNTETWNALSTEYGFLRRME